MDIQTRKLNFIQEILAVNNEKIIDKLESLLIKERSKEDLFNRYTTEDMIARAKRSEHDIAEGRTITTAQFKEDFENWKKNLDPERIQNALFRHVLAYSRGEIIDKESKLPHVCHIMANCMFLHFYDFKGGSVK